MPSSPLPLPTPDRVLPGAPPPLPASLARRAVAFILDLGIALELSAAAHAAYTAWIGPDSDQAVRYGVILAAIVPALSFLALSAAPRSGASPAKRLLGLHLEGSPAGNPPPFANRVVRAGLITAFGPFLGLAAAFSAKRRHFADALTDTRVAERGGALAPAWPVRALVFAALLITAIVPLSMSYRRALLGMPAARAALAQFHREYPQIEVESTPLWVRLHGDRAEAGLASPRGLEVVRLDRPALDWRIIRARPAIDREPAATTIPSLPVPLLSPTAPERLPTLVAMYQGDPKALQEVARLLGDAIRKDIRDPVPRLLRAELIARAAAVAPGPAGSPLSASALMGQADTDLQIALELAPRLYEAHVTAAYLYLVRDDRRQARRELATAAEIKPDGPDHRLLEAHLEMMDGYPDRAVGPLEALLAGPGAQSPLLALKVRRALTSAYVMLHRPADADREFKALIASEEQPASALARYSKFLANEKRFDEAVAAAEKSRLALDTPYGRAALAHALERKASDLAASGRASDEAVTLFQRAIEEDALNVLAYYGAGEVFAAKFTASQAPDMRERAEHYFKSVLKLQPANDDARKALERLASSASR